VLLLFGITGSIAEAIIQPTNLFGGFWVFVYGLMVYLPACTVPEDRPAKPPRWWCYPLAVVARRLKIHSCAAPQNQQFNGVGGEFTLRLHRLYWLVQGVKWSMWFCRAGRRPCGF
jgi:hypothetical protein